jgi:hypothetical protein
VASDPFHEHRPAAYWFWSHIPSRLEAARQLEEFAAAGFGTVMIQARRAFPLELYMSEPYLHAYREAVQSAAQAGLTVGVYDEYCWISGHGGGRTVRGAEELRERHLFWATSSATDPRVARISRIRSEWIDGLGGAERDWLYEGGERRFDEWHVVAVIGRPPQAATAPDAGAEQVDLSAWAVCQPADDGAVVSVAPDAPLPKGWLATAYVSARAASSRLINYLDARAAERFLEVVYEPYAQALAGLLGDPVRFFAFDHPYAGFYDWDGRDGLIGNSLMWLEDTAWLKQLAADGLGRLLWEVVHDRGENGRRRRCEFFAAYSSLGITSFFGTLARWAQAHGVGLTGHEYLPFVGGWGLNDGFPEVDARVNFGSDHFAIDAHRTQTLVDAANFQAQISPCFGASLARAHGREGVVVEQYASRTSGHYAAGYWELTADELRTAALRLELLGARQFLMHAVSQSNGEPWNGELLANPRFDFPPAINFEPWFDQLREVSDELAAVAGFIAGARPLREVAIVYPLYTIWADGPDAPHARLIGEWAALLAQAGVGFDLVDDRSLAQATTAAGPVLQTGRHGYAAIILAGVTMLPDPDCVAALERFATAGGLVLGCGPLAAGLERTLSEPPQHGVPASVPDGILHRLDGITVTASGDGTLWSWQGRDEHGLRVALLNDSDAPRLVSLQARDSQAALSLTLEPGEVRTAMIRPTLVLEHGWRLTADGRKDVPVDPSAGWERQGFASFAGSGLYRCVFDIAWPDLDDPAYSHELTLPAVHCTAGVRLNGQGLGTKLRKPYRFPIPGGLLAASGNLLEVEVRNSAANRYYAGSPFQSEPQPSGLAAAPLITSMRL